jgi:plastocyanin
MRRTAVALALAGLLGAGIALPASSDDRTDRPDGNGPLGTIERVRIVDFAFRPRRIEISRGTRVRWVNAGEVQHTATSRTGVWDSGSLAPGDTFSRVFRSSGTFRYRCTIHTDMRGKVVVT